MFIKIARMFNRCNLYRLQERFTATVGFSQYRTKMLRLIDVQAIAIFNQVKGKEGKRTWLSKMESNEKCNKRYKFIGLLH
ncbi:hypothetical protein BEL04_11125 [Mucilaginibacter sp. PPCGB 2223]|nr:hypothetical protein BEL04_11125 [Mucilaginibacter sp. PPCGB 2223]